MLGLANVIRDRITVPRHDVAFGWTDTVEVIVRVKVTGRFLYRSFRVDIDDDDVVDAVVEWIGETTSP